MINEKGEADLDPELDPEKYTEEYLDGYGIVNVDAPRRISLRNRTVTEEVDLTEPITRSIGKKKHKRGKKSSSNANESTGTIPGGVEQKIRLRNGRRSNIYLFPDPPSYKVPEQLRERHEQN